MAIKQKEAISTIINKILFYIWMKNSIENFQ